jgi:methionyl-tRNA formyltransferase
MRIIFMGTPEFAVPSLEILLSTHHEIISAVTVPDKPQGRGLKISESAVKKFAVKQNLNILQPDNLKDDEFVNKIKSLEPELIVVVAFRILPEEIFTIPKYGSFNLHASLLPKYRGAAPINWAIINGDKETGVTTFFLEKKVDTGNVIMQTKCEITEEDDAGTLHDKLAELGAKTVLSTVNMIEMTSGNVPVFQQDSSIASKAPKIFKEFCRIKWDNETETIFNFIRGLSPYPCAYTFREGKLIKIFETKKYLMSIGTNGKPVNFGEVILQEGKLFITCKDGYLEIIELQIEGRKRMSSEEFLRGHNIKPGEVWG